MRVGSSGSQAAPPPPAWRTDVPSESRFGPSSPKYNHFFSFGPFMHICAKDGHQWPRRGPKCVGGGALTACRARPIGHKALRTHTGIPPGAVGAVFGPFGPFLGGEGSEPKTGIWEGTTGGGQPRASPRVSCQGLSRRRCRENFASVTLACCLFLLWGDGCSNCVRNIVLVHVCVCVCVILF